QICDELGTPCPGYLTEEEGFISLAKEERLQELWVVKLKQELKDIDAPVLAKLQGSLDPDRAANLLAGRTRASTLKRYLTFYKQWRLWLGEAKLRRDERSGRTVPEATLKAVAWVEQVAEFQLEQRASGWPGPRKIVEELSTGAKLTKSALRYPVYIVAQLEKVVMDPAQVVGLRVWAWGKLLKVGGPRPLVLPPPAMPPPLFAPPLPFLLRSVFLPLSVLLLACLAAPVARLFLCLPRICCALLFLYLVGSVADAATAATTATCPRLRRAPVLAPVLARSGWLATGFDLIKKHAGYTTAALLTAIGLLGVVQGFWTEHSERAILPTALSLQDVASQDKDLLVKLDDPDALVGVPPSVAPVDHPANGSATAARNRLLPQTLLPNQRPRRGGPYAFLAIAGGALTGTGSVKAFREPARREEEELRAALEASCKAAMGDGAEVEGANSSASTGPFPPPLPKPKAATLRERSPNATRCPPERPKRYSRSGRCCGTCPTGRPREALKLQESVQRKANSALKGKAVPMDLIKPPPARAKLAVDRFEVRRLLGSLAPSKEIKGKGYGKPKASLAKGSSDLRFLLTHHKVTDEVQAKLFENNVDTAEATNEVREWAKPIPQTDYIAMRQAFATQFGDLEDKRIPAKEYIEKKLHELGGSRTTAPSSPEQLRLRLTVLQNALIMIKLKHPGSVELADVTFAVFERYKDYLLGGLLLRPPLKRGVDLSSIISYEHAIRKHAYKLMATDGRPFGEALAKAYKDATVKERNFTTPLALHAKRHRGKGKLGKGDGMQPTKFAATSSRTPTPDGKLICYRYNAKGGCKKGDKCHFAHVCLHCFAKHPATQCPMLKTKKDDEKQETASAAGWDATVECFDICRERDRAILGDVFADFAWEVATLVAQGAKPTRLFLRTQCPLPPFVYEGPPSFDDSGSYLGPLRQGTWKPLSATSYRCLSHLWLRTVAAAPVPVASKRASGHLPGPCYDSYGGGVQEKQPTQAASYIVPEGSGSMANWEATRITTMGGALPLETRFRVEEWLGMETDYQAISWPLEEESRLASRLARDKATRGRVTAKEFAQGLGRLGFAAIALDWERPFLGPLHAWSSAVQTKLGMLTVPTMLKVLCLWLAERLEAGGRLQRSALLVEEGTPLSFFIDAKVQQSWAPWAFAKGDPNKVIAADNRSNEAPLKKAMTTKFPSTLVLTETAEELSAKNCELQLHWIRRDLNQLADDLTNGKLR
ncbi:unnamed protein product, partial [Symbiodinium sp. KB8]